jgi:hypothetical protein
MSAPVTPSSGTVRTSRWIRALAPFDRFAARYWYIVLVVFLGLLLVWTLYCLPCLFQPMPGCTTQAELETRMEQVHQRMEGCCGCGPRASDRTMFDTRRSEAGGDRGVLTVTLLWSSIDDLDLHLVESNGFRIYHKQPLSPSTGGQLDVDMNREEYVGSPVENIHYPQRPPAGGYEVQVMLYKKRTRGTVNFEVLVQLGDQVRQYRGSLVKEGGLTPVALIPIN